jgi:ATP-dependent RNA helicase DDX55/SPB4
LAELQTKKEKRSAENTSEEMKKKKIRAEMREAWSEKKERKAKKEERREKKDKRKDAEWALELEAAEKEGDIGPIEALRREKAARAAAAEGKKAKATVGGDEDGEEGGFDHEYKVLKKEVREERAAKRLKKGDQGGGLSGGMFDGLE